MLNTKIIIHITDRGQSLIEILVAIGLAAVLLPALVTGLVASREGKAQEGERLVATGLMREMTEAVRQVRETDWDSFAVNGTYHPIVSGSNWMLDSGSESINGFIRQLTISDTERDSSGGIVESGGTVDASTKKVEYIVSWSGSYGGSVEATEYFTRYLNNTAWNQTTQAEFEGGTLTDTVTTNNSGGEVELAESSGGDWALPTLEGSFNNSGNDNSNDIFVSGSYAYLGTTNGGADFSIVNVSDPTSPTLSSALNLGGDINGVFVSGNYAYLASGDNSKELVVINVSNPSSPSEVGSLNLSGNQDATDVFVSGNYAYLSRISSGNPEFYIINISNPASPSLTGSLNISGDANAVYVSGSRAFVASSSNSEELVVINVSSPSSPAVLGSYNASSNANGSDIFVINTSAYLVTLNNGGSGPEFYILDVSNPASISTVGSFNAGDNVNGVYVSGTYAFLATDAGSEEFMVLDISTPASPSQYGSLNLSGNAEAVYVSGDYAYLGTIDNSSEIEIVLGGSGNSYVTSGSIESSTFDAGSSVAFNYLTFSGSTPSGTTLSLQLAINDDNSTWNYFGAYSEGGSIPLDSINGRYIRFKANLAGNGTATPVLSGVSVNYSP